MESGSYDLVGADAWLMDSSFMPRHNCKKKGDPYTYVGCGGMMVKKEVVDRLGLFDEQFNPAYFEDPDFNFRAREAGFKIGWNQKRAPGGALKDAK
jgi:GT2 family glycosyltransferase